MIIFLVGFLQYSKGHTPAINSNSFDLKFKLNQVSSVYFVAAIVGKSGHSTDRALHL